MSERICRLTFGSAGKIHANDELVEHGVSVGKLHDPIPTSLQTVIENDKKFGVLRPKNGASYGYIILNNDTEITTKQVRRAVTNALWRWRLKLKFDFHRVRTRAEADFVFEFRSEAQDSLLTANTLAYMYYPLGGVNNGVCVINTRPYWSLHGNGIDMHYIDPINYPQLGSGLMGKTWDLDQVLGHELGHGMFGLPHYFGIMASHYGIMAEFAQENDILRAHAKGFEIRNSLNRKWIIMSNWLFHSSDRA